MCNELLSARLVGTPRTAGSYAELRRLHSDRAVMRTLSADGEPLSAAKTEAGLEASLRHAAEHGLGVWHFHTHESGAFIGYCGLKRTLVTGQPETELLYAVGSWAWRQGYATEMARAVADHAMAQPAMEAIVAYTLPHNAASRAVMERLGFRYECEIVHVGLAHVLYRLERGPRPTA